MTDKGKICILEWPSQSPDPNPVEKSVNYRAALVHVAYVILRYVYLYAVFFFFSCCFLLLCLSSYGIDPLCEAPTVRIHTPTWFTKHKRRLGALYRGEALTSVFHLLRTPSSPLRQNKPAMAANEWGEFGYQEENKVRGRKIKEIKGICKKYQMTIIITIITS